MINDEKREMKYTNFTELMTATEVDEQARKFFTRGWLKTQYNINYQVNPEWADLLTEVHDHDNLPKHFGKIQLASSFSSFYTQIVQDQNGVWRLAYTANIEDTNAGKLVPLVNDKNVSRVEFNQLRGHIKSIVTKNKVQTNLIQPPPVVATVPELSFGDNVMRKLEEADSFAEESDLPSFYDPTQGTKTISISLDDLMK